MVSLTGQNRILVKNGLLKIAEAKRPGLAELKGASGFSPVAALGAGQVVFNLAPRINAAGRLAAPRWPTTCCSHPRTTKPPNWPKR